MSSLGDINGDGYPDLIVASPSGNIPGGHAYVFLGGPLPHSAPNLSLPTPKDSTLYFQNPDDDFGLALSGVGDVNGDGFPDWVVGEPKFIGGHPGHAFLYLGGKTLPDGARLVLQGDVAGDWFGGAVSRAGDFNHDGFEDFLIGSPLYNAYLFPDNLNTGRAHIFFGNPSLDHLDRVTLESAQPYPNTASISYGFGVSVADLGDLNGEGFDDIAVGQTGRFSDGIGGTPYGRVSVFYGGDEEGSLPDLLLKGTPNMGPLAGSVAGVGDFNNDGYPDVAVIGGKVGNASGIYVYFGGPNLSDYPRPGLILKTNPAPDVQNVIGGADVNGDGIPDIIASNSSEYFVLVYYGGSSPDSLPNLVLRFPCCNHVNFGQSITTLDWNGDGVQDIAVGAPGGQPFFPVEGHVFIYDVSTPLPARAFLQGDHRVVPLAQGPSSVCVRLEPRNGDYENSQVDWSTLRLVSAATGTVTEIPALSSKATSEDDTDRNGVLELSVCFGQGDLAQLFSAVEGRKTVDVAIEGRLLSHRRFRAPFSMDIVGTGKWEEPQVSLSPNPFNPQGTLEFTTTASGPVSLRVFDVSGRLVRTFLDHQILPNGSNRILVDGKDGRGVALSSGVYFYRLEYPGGVTQGRFVIAK